MVARGSESLFGGYGAEIGALEDALLGFRLRIRELLDQERPFRSVADEFESSLDIQGNYDTSTCLAYGGGKVTLLGAARIRRCGLVASLKPSTRRLEYAKVFNEERSRNGITTFGVLLSIEIIWAGTAAPENHAVSTRVSVPIALPKQLPYISHLPSLNPIPRLQYRGEPELDPHP